MGVLGQEGDFFFSLFTFKIKTLAKVQWNFHFRCEYIQNKKREEDIETVYMLVNKREEETRVFVRLREDCLAAVVLFCFLLQPKHWCCGG